MEFGGLKLKRCRYGWMLFAGPYIGKCFDLYGEYSESEVALMRRFLRPGDTAVDVGANIGDLTVPLAGIVGDAGRVYALESNPATFNVLCANLALNGVRNVKPVNAFVATNPGVDTSGPWGKYAYTGEVWEPQFVALDALGARACHLLKVDVDGKELEVLRSAERLIRDHRPVLYFENDDRAQSGPLLGFALGAGYDLYWHPAPIFRPDNFFENPENQWAPRTIVSLMVLGLPRERPLAPPELRRVRGADDWWDA
ncbi:cobalt-precorrin-6Y C(15)-methyltransferase [Gemmata sp. SH-PL17]|uniref:FkbM family methyltransferase n=1 Tax=Gemmata sp. SH-PL17 TaxID=1630693 RepID=UPI00078E0F75|nr:FkbM family methyltransferase [Gemmata sp. SH-PL17]AMV25177.1 cobalt-precorrin-6Y C(15)-methyltransferase [Gemmata sp. SH-PL17]